MKKIILLVIVLAIVGGGAYVYKVRTAPGEPAVTSMPFSRGDVVQTVGATGTLEAVETVEVGTQVSGVVQALYADFNTIVRRGQVIARLDPQLIQTQIEQQQANVIRAEADLERLHVALADAKQKYARAQQMAEKNLIPRTELETAEVNVRSAEAQIRSSEAALTQARAQLNNQRVNLGYTTITAPIDGIVISRNVDQGQTVAASMNAPTLYVLAADLTKMQVIANIDEADVGSMRPGQVVNFRVDAYPTDVFRGSVSQVRLQPTVVQNVVTYSTVISVPNPELKLKPGMTANVTIEIARRNNVLRVSNRALAFRPTPDMFAALGQEVPAELQRGPGGFGGRGRGELAGSGPAGPGAQAAGASPAGPRGEGSAQASAAPRGGGPNSPAAGADASAGGARGGSDGAGRGEGRGGFDPNISPEERQRRMEERMAGMSPEERARLQERMREGGARGGRQGNGAPAAAAGRQGGRGAAQAQPSTIASEATTIDSLFAPIQVQERTAIAWVFADRQLKPLRLRLGVSDGSFTEVVNEQEVSETTETVVAMTTGQEGRSPALQNPQGNPLMGPQRGGPGGRGGAGGGRGGRG